MRADAFLGNGAPEFALASLPPYGERRREEGIGVPGEGADWAKDERSLHWGREGRWGGARKETGDLEFILKATGSLMGWRENKRGHYKDPSVSSVIGIGGPLWKWEEQLGRGPNRGCDAAALNGCHTLSRPGSLHTSCHLWNTKAVLLRETETTSGDPNSLPRMGAIVGGTPSIS